MSEIFERLREERVRLNLSQDALAGAGGVQRRAQVNYESGERSPDSRYLSGVADLGIDVLYVLTGRREGGRQAQSMTMGVPALYDAKSGSGAALLAAQAQVQLACEAAGAWKAVTATTGSPTASSDITRMRDLPPTNDGLLRSAGALLPAEQGAALQPLVLRLLLGGESGAVGYHVVPRRVVPASAGRGVAASTRDLRQVDLAGDMAFTADWLRHNLGHTSGALCSVKVQGDSMSGTLLDGETILVDQGVSQVDVDGIYVLEIYGRQLVKRVQRLFDGSLVLISDNEQYQREQIPRDQARDVVVVGRMVYPRVR